MNPKVAMLILRMAGSKEGRSGLRVVVIGIISALAAVVLLIAAIVDILTTPFALAGELGLFQEEYSYLVAAETVEFGEALTDAEINALLDAADTEDPDRLAVLQTAFSLVGRVPYFWGGKSAAGWNEEWNTMKLVTAAGSSTSDTMRPYGLDCSGYTDWVWRTAGYKSIGGGTTAQYGGSIEISEDDLVPGDLVFKNCPGDEGINHVGIYYGKDDDGKNLYIHCSAGAGGVVMNTYSGFQYFRRPKFSAKEE